MASRIRPDKTVSFGHVGAVDFQNRTFEGLSTVPSLDRDREYLPLDAVSKHFDEYIQNNAVLLLGHQHKTTIDSLPIGKCVDYKFLDDSLWTKFYVTRRPIGDDILTLLDEGILKGISMGFIPIDFIPNPADHQLPTFLRGKGLRKYYKEVETVEISLLSIPSNRHSLVIHAEKGNRVANMITKGWRGEDVTPIIKAWLSEEEGEDPYKKHLWLGFTLQPESREALSAIEAPGKKLKEDDLHVTLRYFGDVDKMSDVDDVKEALIPLENTLAANYDLDPVSFETFQDACLVARYRNAAISQLHEKVNALLEKVSVSFPENFPHLDAHVTLSQGDDLASPEDKPPLAQTGQLQLRWGKDDIIHEFTPHQVAWNSFVSKLFDWNESEHPRANDGQFTSAGGGGGGVSTRPWFMPSKGDIAHEEINKKLDTIIQKSDQVQQKVNEIQDQSSWKNWARGWVIKVGAVIGAYYGVKHLANSPEVKRKIKDWIVDAMRKEYSSDPIDKLLRVMDFTKSALAKGAAVGASETPEYKKLQAFYNKAFDQLKAASEGEAKGLSSLWVTKEMTPESFKEEEHPRAVDGKFRKKSSGSGLKKAKADHVEPEPEKVEAELAKPEMESIKTEVVTPPGKEKTEEEAAKDKKRKELRKQRQKEREEHQERIQVAIAATIAFAYLGYAAYKFHSVKAEQEAWDRAFKTTRERMRTSAEGASQRAKSQTDRIWEDFDRIFKERRKNHEEEFAKAKEQWKKRTDWRARDEEWKKEYAEKERQERHRKFDEWFRRNFGGGQGGSRSEGQSGKANSYSNFATGPEIKEGVSKTWDRMKPIRDTAKLLIDQIKKGTYEDIPVPRDAMSAHGALKLFNGKLKKEIGKVPGVKEIHEDAEKTLVELERLIKANWEKHGVKEGFAAKDFDDIVTKDWTSEDEREHPRAPAGSDRGGEFVSKNEPGSSSASKNEPSPDSGAWGGVRKNAGRTAKNPVVAAQRLQERFKEENPGIPDEEVKKKMIDHAVEKRNGDLYLYLTDPVGFQKKQEQDIVAAMASKPGKIKTGSGNTVDKIDDPKETNAIYNDIKTTASGWKREVQQASDIHSAYKTFTSSGKPEELEVARAKLITAAAAVATIVGLGVVYAKRPNLLKAGFTETAGETWARPFTKEGMADILGRDKATMLRWFRAQDLSDPNLTEIEQLAKFKSGVIDARQIGAIRSLMGRVAKKMGKVDPETGETLYPFLGPMMTGMGPTTMYRPRRFDIFSTAKNYVPKAGDVDAESGLQTVFSVKWRKIGDKRVIDKVGVDYINLAIGTGRLPKNPADWKGKLPPGVFIAEDLTGRKFWQFQKGKATIRTSEISPGEPIKPKKSTPLEEEASGEAAIGGAAKEAEKKAAAKTTGQATKEERSSEQKFIKWLSQQDKRSKSVQAVVDEQGNVLKWPPRIGRELEGAEYDSAQEASKNFKGLLHFFNRDILPKVSGRTLGILSAVAGVGGAAESVYYFQGNIENFLSRHFKQKEESEAEVAKIGAPLKKPKGVNDQLKLELALEKQKTKTAEAQKGAAYQKEQLESKRASIRVQLVELGIRKYVEGSVEMWATKGDTFYKRLHDSGMLDNEEGLMHVLDVLHKPTKDKVMALYKAVRKASIVRNNKDWDQFYRDGTLPNEDFGKRETPEDMKRGQEAKAAAEKAAAEKEANKPETETSTSPSGETVKKRRGKEMSGLELITKMFEPEDGEIPSENDKTYSLDDVIDQMAVEIASMIADISQSCKTVVESGMPGATGYAQLNDIVTEIYAYLKDHSKKNPEKVETKGVDNIGPMSSQSDAGGGLFSEARRCKVCGRVVTEELLMSCKKSGCPFSYLEKVVDKTKEVTG